MKIPTAEEIILKHCNQKTNDYGTSFGSINEEQCRRAMIEFAKLHVEQALKQASEIVYNEIEKDFITEESILNSYPLDNIK